ncbi:MAG: hypothetical protein U0528_11090 [Anaerolineae bacterium]
MGVGDSYWAETIAAVCILAGIFAGRSLNRSWRIPPDSLAQINRWLKRLGIIASSSRSRQPSV